MKLLLIAPTCNGDDVGEAWIAHQWAKGLAKRHEVTLLTYHKRGARPAAEQLSGLRVIEWTEPAFLGRTERLNSMMKPGYVPFYFRTRRWIRQALARGERFDLAHQPVPVAMRYPSPAAGLGIPLVMGPVGGGLSSPPGFSGDDGSSPWFMGLRRLDQYRLRWDPWLRRTYGEAECVVGIAEYVRDRLAAIPLRRFESIPDTALDSIPDWIDRAPHDGPLRLLFVGRLARTKGIRDAVRAMAHLRDLNVRLDIVGEGPERAPCSALVTDLRVDEKVVFHGWKSKSEVAEFYRRADVFIFPSYREPGGGVVMEAMGYSLPMIVADRGGPASNTTDAFAIKLAAESPAALAQGIADAVRQLELDPGSRRRMSARAHRHAVMTATWASKLERFDKLYLQVAASL